MGLFSFFKRNKEVEQEQKQELDKGLEKTRTSVFDRISKAIIGKSKVDDEVLDNLEEVDALVTHLPGFCICVSTADCIPVLLYDKEKQVVAAVHAGWRGTVGRIVENTLQVMKKVYNSDGKDIIACIGPGISLDSFEVGDEVYQAFEDAGFDMPRISRKENKWHIDLWEANRLQLLECGVCEENIEVAGVCTFQSYDMFFSARRMGIHSGRILSGIMLYK